MNCANVPSVGIIIPARFASTRFPGKPLELLRGADGVKRPLIEHSWQTASAVPGVSSVWVATDDQRIADAAEGFGAEVVITPPECPNGTARCAAALALRDDRPDIVVNFQGDAPLTPVAIVSSLIDRLRDNETIEVATPGVRCSRDAYRHLVDDQRAGRVGGTTVVFNASHEALYFSKQIIPHIGAKDLGRSVPVFLHLGVYAYRQHALKTYVETPSSELERLEGLEQLRFLDIGVKVSIVTCAPPHWEAVEVNNPSDIAVVEAMLQRRGAIERKRTDAPLRS